MNEVLAQKVTSLQRCVARHLDDLLQFAQTIRAQMDGEPRTDNG
jgi:tRNA isopentenyl-2-thiomethyl-A-37 hydroxylase MiaE